MMMNIMAMMRITPMIYAPSVDAVVVTFTLTPRMIVVSWYVE